MSGADSLAGRVDHRGAGRDRSPRLPAWSLLRFGLRQLSWPGWVGLGLLTVAAAILLAATPLLQAANVRSAAAVAALQAEATQLRDPKAARARSDPIGALVASLPPVSSVPDFVAAVQRRADQAAVQIDRAEYRVQPILGRSVARYRVSFPARVDYPHLRTFLEALLHDYPNLILDDLALRREVDGGEELEAHVSLSFVVRTGS